MRLDQSFEFSILSFEFDATIREALPTSRGLVF